MRYVLFLTGIILAAVGSTASAVETPTVDLRRLASDAVSENHATADSAIKELREAGPEGLAALLSVHEDLIKRQSAKSPLAREAANPTWQRLCTALDAVGGQYNCRVSRLFWYTDLEAAKAAARREGKPILSLRLLGNLNDELSCANSRFFRTTLYANEEVSRALREGFVLHWKSVRPVPKVTIDFGDGRKLERTVTGNSIHYVLDCEGRPIDALPGLYGPKAFLRELQRAEQAAKEVASLPPLEWSNFLSAYHRDRAKAIQMAWQEDLRQLGVTLPETSYSAAADSLALATTEAKWNQIAGLHSKDAALDAASVALIRSQQPTAARAAGLAITKMAVEDPLVRMVRNFQGAISLDTVRNEYLFHRRIHEWLADNKSGIELDRLNERVYAELFLTPSSDPWLGLVPADVYTALQNGGVVQDRAR
jgi:hypothetical protein